MRNTLLPKPIDVIVFPHTHWDREWYRTFQEFRVRLVAAIDRIVFLLEEDVYPFFMLDGQAIVVEDYLAIKPEMRPRLEKLIREKKLAIGPWYILPDEFLVSGEAIIRNLLRGIKITLSLGGERPKTGYLPDMFGHIGQMPQILRGFGCQQAVVWRGVDIEASSFEWVAPDGTSIPTHYLVDGYHNVSLFEKKGLSERIEETKVFLARFQGKADILFPVGSDHLAPVSEMPGTLAEVAKHFPGHSFRIGPIEGADLQPSLKIFGNLRYPSKAYLLQGVLSSRMSLKQQNAACQGLLERYAEPTSALVKMAGGDYPEGLLEEAWRLLLQNHPHDSICGCSVDEVHREMNTRFASVQQLGNTLVESNLLKLSPNTSEPGIILFNPTSRPRREWLKTTIDWPEETAAAEVSLFDLEGKTLPCFVEGAMSKESFQAGGDFVPYWQKVKQYAISFLSPEIPPMGTVVLFLRSGETALPEGTVRIAENSLENEYFFLSVSRGQLRLRDKQSNRLFEDVHFFVDGGDAGDEYTYSPPESDKVERSRLVGCSIMRQTAHWGVLRLDYEIEIPLALTADRRERSEESRTIRIFSYVSLRSGERRVEIKTELSNECMDHRLRVVFGFGKGAPQAFREGAFGIFFQKPLEEKPLLPVSPLQEAPVPTFAQQGFSLLDDSVKGLAIAAKGLPEVEAMCASEEYFLALTLLRSVDWLSRDDLRTRGGGAGPHFPTPDAQCIGYQSFEYAIIPFSGKWEEAGIQQEAHFFLHPVWIQPFGNHRGAGFFDSSDRLFVEDSRLVVSALKKSAWSDSLLLRLYNPTGRKLESRVKVRGFRAFSCDLLEEEGEFLGEDFFEIALRPFAIESFLLK